MLSKSSAEPLTWPVAAWLSAALAGIIVPAAALLVLAVTADGAAGGGLASPVLALGLMGSGMISAAAAGRIGTGLLLALLAGAGLIALAWAAGIYAGGMPAIRNPFVIGAVFVIASFSFAARGYLFARSAFGKGWFIAVFVVAGEAAVLVTAMAQPGLLPDWLLALLPAQWANMAIETALLKAGPGLPDNWTTAIWALAALAATAAATVFAASQLPRRWPYTVMFTTWLGMSALVYHSPSLASAI